MNAAALAILAAMAALAPKDGAKVPLLKPSQAKYLSAPREERFRRMESAADRAALFAAGQGPLPLRIEWTLPESAGADAVCEITVRRAGGEERTFSATNATSAYLVNLESGAAYAWSVACGGERCGGSFETEPDAPRLLRAPGVGNFRDLGGWRTADGRRVRQNRIFRSAGLRGSSKSSGGFIRRKVTLGPRRVEDAGLAALKDEFRIRTDLELRSRDETAGMEDTLVPGAKWIHIPFAAYDFISNPVRGREPFAKIFRAVADPKNQPVLFHCSGGRDRTGTVAFLLNGLLGVQEDDLCRDWEATVFADQGPGFAPVRIKRLLEYLASLPGDTMRDRIEHYVRGCGISDSEIEAFRASMLEQE